MQAATKEVEKDFDSVFSRLVLCRTFRLDEDGKVLTPEEILYRVSDVIMTRGFQKLIPYFMNWMNMEMVSGQIFIPRFRIRILVKCILSLNHGNLKQFYPGGLPST